MILAGDAPLHGRGFLARAVGSPRAIAPTTAPPSRATTSISTASRRRLVEEALKKHGYNISLAAHRTRPVARRTLSPDGEAWALTGVRFKVASCSASSGGWRLLVLAAFAFAAVAGEPDSARRGSSPACSSPAPPCCSGARPADQSRARAVHRRGPVRRFRQGFSHRGQGSGFAELSTTLDEAISALRDERHKLIDANRFYEAVLDDAPTPLLTVDGEGRVELANKAARRLLVRHQGVRIEDFRGYGDAFAARWPAARRPAARWCRLLSDGVPQTHAGQRRHRPPAGGLVRVVAVQPIQGELNAVEIAAQTRSGPRPDPRDHELDDSGHLARPERRRSDGGRRPRRQRRHRRRARIAVETLARRAEGVMHFVESYRQISRDAGDPPPPFDAAAWGREIGAPVPRQRSLRRGSGSACR